MHASSTPRMVDQRPAAAALAAIFLTVGLAFGAAIGITIAPTTSVAVPGAGATGISPADSSAALQQHVLRENAAAQGTAIDLDELRGALGSRVFDRTFAGSSVITTYRDERGPWRDEGLLTGPSISPAYTVDDLFRGDHGLARRAAFPDAWSSAPVGHPDHLRAQPR